MKSFGGENPTALNLDPQMGVVVSLGLCQPLIETERGTGWLCAQHPGSAAVMSARPSFWVLLYFGGWRRRQQKSLAASEL